MEDKNLSLTDHLEDLRRALTVSVIAVVLASTVSYFAFGDQLFKLVTEPLAELDVKLVYIGMTEAFMTKIKLGILAGVIVAFPVILWQVWGFIAPALFPREKRMLLVILPLSILLFALGAVFAYLVVFKFAAYFLLVTVSGEELMPMLSVSQYVSFLLVFLLPFGLIFELPLLIYFLTRMGLVTYQLLVKNRKLAILGFFIFAAILTPPDVISQTLLAVPMMLLYEVSVLVARFVKPKQQIEMEISSTDA